VRVALGPVRKRLRIARWQTVRCDATVFDGDDSSLAVLAPNRCVEILRIAPELRISLEYP
jgi:hypothetical protein